MLDSINDENFYKDMGKREALVRINSKDKEEDTSVELNSYDSEDSLDDA